MVGEELVGAENAVEMCIFEMSYPLDQHIRSTEHPKEFEFWHYAGQSQLRVLIAYSFSQWYSAILTGVCQFDKRKYFNFSGGRLHLTAANRPVECRRSTNLVVRRKCDS